MRDGGDGGIRTLDRALQPYNGLANRRLQPLGHVSTQADMPDAGATRKRQICTIAISAKCLNIKGLRDAAMIVAILRPAGFPNVSHQVAPRQTTAAQGSSRAQQTSAECSRFRGGARTSRLKLASASFGCAIACAMSARAARRILHALAAGRGDLTRRRQHRRLRHAR